MILVSLIIVAGHFSFWVYAYWLVVRVQKALYQSFPEEANQFLGTRKSFGINRKKGLLFLWEVDIKNLTRRDKALEGLRQHAVRCLILLLAMLFFMPVLIFIIWWLTSIISIRH